MKKIVLLIMVAFYSCTAMAQLCKQDNVPSKAQKFYAEALEFHKRTQYPESRAACEKAVKAFPDYVDAHMFLGQLYEGSDIKTAIMHYEKAISIMPDCSPMMYILIAEAYRKDQQFEKALENYLVFKDEKVSSLKWNTIMEKGKADCEFAIEAMKHPVNFEPKNLGAQVNSKFDDYFPSLTIDEGQIIFARTLFTEGEKDNINEEIYISNKADTDWHEAFNIGAPVNTDANEGAQTISPDGKFIFFTRCNAPGGMGSCDLYVTKYENGVWLAPANLGPDVNTPGWESQPCIGSDGKTLYFTSVRRGGHGGADIYLTRYENKRWTKPLNLGKNINTPYDEKSPFIHPDGVTLYFNSDGHPGMGNLDFFVSQKMSNDTTWQKPMNLGYPINTAYEERSIFLNGKGDLAYISSDRQGGYGLQDLYSFETYAAMRPQQVTYVKGHVIDANTKKSLSGEITLIDLESGDVISKTESDEKTGTFLIALPIGKDYMYSVDKKGYLFASENFNLKEAQSIDKPYELEIPLKPIKLGESIILKNIFYESNSYVLKDLSKTELNKLAVLLKENTNMKIEISGYTDNVGSDSDNLKLSENRAKSVVQYLTEAGISSSRLTYKGFGEAQPIADNSTEEGRALNRRTEFKVISN